MPASLRTRLYQALVRALSSCLKAQLRVQLITSATSASCRRQIGGFGRVRSGIPIVLPSRLGLLQEEMILSLVRHELGIFCRVLCVLITRPLMKTAFSGWRYKGISGLDP